MLAFRVSINGEVACTAVSGELVSLMAFAKGTEAVKMQKATAQLDGYEQVQNLSEEGGCVQVFGSMGAGVAIAEWLDQGIVAGDRIEIEVLNAAQTTPSQPNSLYDRSKNHLP